MYLWHAADSEGEVLDLLVQSRRDNRPAGDPHEHLVQVPNATRSPAASAQALDSKRTEAGDPDPYHHSDAALGQ